MNVPETPAVDSVACALDDGSDAVEPDDELDELPWLSAALGLVAADWLSSVAVAATVAACVAVLVW